jgi:hypothetical protein
MILAASLFAIIAPEPSLAFVARFYKPGSEKSRFEIYVSDFEGKNRKSLPTTEVPNFVQWIGKNRLAWTSDTGLWTSKLSPWKPVKVLRSANVEFLDSRSRASEPGDPDIEVNTVGAQAFYKMDPSSGKIAATQKAIGHDEIMLTEGSPVTIDNPSSADHPLKLQMYETFEYWNGEKMDTCDGEPVRAWNSDNGAKLWVLVGTHSSSSGAVNEMVLFEKDKAPKKLFADANLFDLWPGRAKYAFTTSRETTPLGKLQVWTSELRMGDWKTGNQWTVVKGLVWVPSASIRP